MDLTCHKMMRILRILILSALMILLVNDVVEKYECGNLF